MKEFKIGEEVKKELWQPVIGLEELYEVSSEGRVKSLGRVVYCSDGRVRNCKGKIMKSSEKAIYLEVRLTDEYGVSKAYTIHTLVAKAFISNPDNRPVVNHRDGNKHNNCVDNLEWTSYSENNQHAYDNCLKTDNRKIAMYDLNGSYVRAFNSIHEASRYVNGNIGNIHSVCNGKRKSANGYRWSYLEDISIADNQLLFAKIKSNAIVPTKHYQDAGWDIYACFDEQQLTILPGETKMIPTGIASAFSPKFYAQLEERGSTGTKGISQRCGVIDSGYRGEWGVPVTNVSNVPIVIDKGGIDWDEFYGKGNVTVYPYSKAICQAVMLEVPVFEVKEVLLEEIMAIESLRGTGRLGSSQK